MSNGVLTGNAVIGQSGGPTAVINQSLVGVVQALKPHDEVGQIFGAVHAVRGMVDDKLMDLKPLGDDVLERLAATPSSGLGSSRDKPDKDYCRRIFEKLEQRNIRYFFYIGGNDSSDTCRIINELAREDNYELRCFHVPKTIDNDLVMNDHTPGFASAAKFVAQAFMGDNLDNRALPGIKINVVMGRHAGFLTAASLMARERDDDGPHLIYVPEVAFDEEQFIADVDRVYKQHGRCLIAVSEGIHDAAGTPMVTKLAQEIEQDAHGNIQLSGTGALGDFLATAIKNKLGAKLRVRADTFGYLQRCFAGCVSEVDQAEARAVGRKAAECAMAGDVDGSIAIQRVNDDPYQAEFKRIELSDVAAKTRVLPAEWILDGNNIDDAFRSYLRPLLGELPTVEKLPLMK